MQFSAGDTYRSVPFSVRRDYDDGRIVPNEGTKILDIDSPALKIGNCSINEKQKVVKEATVVKPIKTTCSLSKYDVELHRYTNAIQTTYASYVRNGGDGEGVLKIRGETLGYDNAFLDKLLPIENSDEIKQLFMSFCGSGNPLRIDDDKHLPKQGETVVDLGCGAGHDLILSSALVGSYGKVVGVDFTQAMLDQSQANVGKYCTTNPSSFGAFEFVKGGIDDPKLLSVEQNPDLRESANVVISNGVFNLCAKKLQAFKTAFDLLKAGGRFLLNDVCVVDENPNVTISCTIGDDVSS